MTYVTESIEHNGITVEATDRKPVRLDRSSMALNEVNNNYIGSMVHTYNTRLSLEGIGTNEYRNINFYVTGPVDVYVVAKSSLVNDVRDRTLILSNNINAENIIDSKVINYGDLYKLEYTGTKAQRLYLASQLDNIYIYYIAIAPKDTTCASSVHGWDFSGDIPTTNNIINDTVDYNGMTITSTSNTPVKIVRSSNSINGFKYEQCLDLCGTGDRTIRNVTFVAQKNSDIYITARSSGSTNRTLAVRNEHGEEITDITDIEVTPTITTYKVSNTGNTQRLRLYSKSNGIRIYTIYVVPQNTSLNVSVPDYIMGNIFNEGTTAYTDYTVISNLYLYATTNFPITAQTVNDMRVLTATTNPPFYNKGGYFAFNVPNSTDTSTQITINATSNDTIYIANAYGMIIAEIPAGSEFTSTTVTYTGYSDKLYMYSMATMNLAGISVQNNNISANAYEMSEESEYYMNLYNLSIAGNEAIIDDVVLSDSSLIVVE